MLLTTIIVLIILGFEFFLRFFHFDVDGETIVVELSCYGFLEIFFSLVRPTSLHNESDQSFVKFIARVNFGM